jgi:hypothetical protein
MDSTKRGGEASPLVALWVSVAFMMSGWFEPMMHIKYLLSHPIIPKAAHYLRADKQVYASNFEGQLAFGDGVETIQSGASDRATSTFSQIAKIQAEATFTHSRIHYTVIDNCEIQQNSISYPNSGNTVAPLKLSYEYRIFQLQS